MVTDAELGVVQQVIEDVEDMKSPSFRRRYVPFLGFKSVPVDIVGIAFVMAAKRVREGDQVVGEGIDAGKRRDQIDECPLLEFLRDAKSMTQILAIGHLTKKRAMRHVFSNLDIGGRALGDGRVEQCEHRLDFVAGTRPWVCTEQGSRKRRLGHD